MVNSDLEFSLGFITERGNGTHSFQFIIVIEDTHQKTKTKKSTRKEWRSAKWCPPRLEIRYQSYKTVLISFTTLGSLNLSIFIFSLVQTNSFKGPFLWESSSWGRRWQIPSDPGWHDRGPNQVWWGRGRGSGGGPRQVSLSPWPTPQCLGRLQQRSRGLSLAISQTESKLGGRLERAWGVLHAETWLDHSQNLLRG